MVVSTLVEELPNSSSAAPGWAYVTDTGYDPSKAALQPASTTRVRASRHVGVAAGDESSRRQLNALAKRLEDLQRDNHRDVQIPIPSKLKEGKGARSKLTPAVRKILQSQKTIANYLDDEAAFLASKPSHQSTITSSASTPYNSHQAKQTRAGSAIPPLGHPTAPPDSLQIPPSELFPADETTNELLKSTVPSAPPPHILHALLTAPPLSYAASRAEPSNNGYPQRHFCEICGYWGLVRCIRCGKRVCGMECLDAHNEGQCLKFYA
ncbi:MAG: hypothetical protein M1834_006114 [Cirrosporium novae-zelandiae]|nr:MAG: hypothetical protein M1834_006114 [Cirrosporium novae-zelandiae]